MKLRNLTLRAYRGFQSLELPFEEDVTVLVGVNGAGKTSILDAAALLASCLAAGIREDEDPEPRLQATDIRRATVVGSRPPVAEIAMLADAGEGSLAWSLGRIDPAITSSKLDALDGFIRAARDGLARGEPNLPLVVYFPTNRSVLDIPARIRTPHEFGPLSAYDGALENGASDFRGFFEWFREEEDVLHEPPLLPAFQAEPRPPSALPAVCEAIERFVPGARDLRILRRPQRMTLVRDGVLLDVGQLSDGERCLLAMVGDLARRMALAAPMAEHPLHHPAVVLIDEIELHLHPGLQRDVLPRLRAVFPNAQLIVSTHSPQVLSSVRRSSVRILDRFTLHRAERGTWHRDTNRILESVFGDPGRLATSAAARRAGCSSPPTIAT